MRFVVRMRARVTAESASHAQLGIDHVGYEPADVDAVLAVLPCTRTCRMLLLPI